jgi:hypothetical protein
MDSSEDIVEQLRLLKEEIQRIADALEGVYDQQKKVLRVTVSERGNR